MRFLFIITAAISVFCGAYSKDTNLSNENYIQEFRVMMREIIGEVSSEFNTTYQFDEDEDDVDFSSNVPKKELAETFFQKLDDAYNKKMEMLDPEYLMFYGCKGMFSAPNFENCVKYNYGKVIQIRDEYFTSMIELCNDYPDDEFSKEVKKQIIEISSRTIEDEWADTLFLLYGVSSQIDEVERELIQEIFIENIIKYFMIFDLAWEEDSYSYYFSDCYEEIFIESFYKSVMELCNASKNPFLNKIYEKYHGIERVYFNGASLYVPALENMNYNYFDDYSEFKYKIYDLYDDYDDERFDMLKDCFPI